MPPLKVEYVLNERALELAIDERVSRNQEMFSDDLRRPLQLAARQVIYGNFTNSGPYDPRPIGAFKGPRASYMRGWVESNYGSQRRYLAGGHRRADDGGDRYANFDHLRNHTLLEAVGQLGERNPSYAKVAAEARQAKLASGDPLRAQPRSGYDNLRGFLGSSAGQKLARKHRPKPRPKGEMKYGVQTGKLAHAWYDLGVVGLSADKLAFGLRPAMGSTTGTPEANTLTEYLSRNRGWRGLMDHKQLVRALADQGVIVVN